MAPIRIAPASRPRMTSSSWVIIATNTPSLPLLSSMSVAFSRPLMLLLPAFLMTNIDSGRSVGDADVDAAIISQLLPARADTHARPACGLHHCATARRRLDVADRQPISTRPAARHFAPMPSRLLLSTILTAGMLFFVLYRMTTTQCLLADRGMFILGCSAVAGFFADVLKFVL